MKSRTIKFSLGLLLAVLFLAQLGRAQMIPSDGGGSSSKLQPRAGQTYFIIAKHSGLAVDIAGGATANGSGLIQYPLHKGANQQFKMLDGGSGTYLIQSVSSGKCIDVDACRKEDGTKVQIWDKHGGGNQQFRIEAQGDGYFKITNVCTGKVLDFEGGPAAKGAGQKMHSWRYLNAANQQFKFQAVGTATPPPPPPPASNAIIYGKTYHLKNGYANWGGGYLDVCGNAAYPLNKYNVSTTPSSNRSSGSGTWKIVSAQGKSNGTVVMDGDRVRLLNMYSGGQGGYLDVCGKVNCNQELYDCSTSPSGDRDGVHTSTWTIATLQSGPVEVNEMVQFRTEYNQWWLQTCGHDNCSGNTSYDVNVWPSRNRVQNVTEWKMVPAQ